MTTCWNKSCPPGNIKGLKEGDYTTSLKMFHYQIDLQMLLTVYPHHIQEKGNRKVNYGSLTLEYCVAAQNAGFYTLSV